MGPNFFSAPLTGEWEEGRSNAIKTMFFPFEWVSWKWEEGGPASTCNQMQGCNVVDEEWVLGDESRDSSVQRASKLDCCW